ncbi:TolC family protein [Reichenbachiella carrageenanivorans]|uniref:TolC family protein n=1 Tax=Reichenbachiella carrageenanivorans TaxID=2979869 RepID=A0ABY6CWM2_9BACT|nr:TolC family protein [Reichenbachiella carrageenanivorans]UXX78314.1 TolC family protein [Reichenbachiella carrageenanivorans]
MKRVIYFIGLLFWLMSNTGMSQSLDDYLLEAAENNPGLKGAYLRFEAAMERVDQSNALQDPTLSFGYFISPVETRLGPQRVKIGLSQMFPWFGTLSAKEEVANAQAEAAYQMFVDQRDDLFLRVKKLYFLLAEINEHIQWQEENLKILETYKALSTTQFSNSKGSMVNVIRVDILMESAMTEIMINREKKQAIEYAFATLLNRQEKAKIVVEPFESQISPVIYDKDSLLLYNPKLKAKEFQISSAESMQRVAKKQGMPKIGLGLDYVFVGDRTDISVPDNGKNVVMPMFTLSLPIYRKKYKSAIKEAELTQMTLVAEKEELVNGLVSSYYMTKNELETAQQRIALFDHQIESTSIAIDLLYSAYENSGQDFEDVLQMQQELLKYKMAKATAIKQYNLASAQLNYLIAHSNITSK